MSYDKRIGEHNNNKKTREDYFRETILFCENNKEQVRLLYLLLLLVNVMRVYRHINKIEKKQCLCVFIYALGRTIEVLLLFFLLLLNGMLLFYSEIEQHNDHALSKVGSSVSNASWRITA